MGTKSKKVALGTKEEHIFIPPPNVGMAAFVIEGKDPLVVHQMSQKTRTIMRTKMEQGDLKVAGVKKKRAPRNFQEDFEGSQHIEKDHGWTGFPAQAIKNSMVAACRTTQDKMTHVKLAFWVQSEGLSKFGTGLIRITKRKPHPVVHPAPVSNGRWDLRVRAMFDPGWQATVRIIYDADMISLESLGNLLMRAGHQVGILEGRNFSRMSCGMGWGGFTVLDKPKAKKEGKKTHEAA